MNFRIYWDGDPQDELLDGTTISKYGGSGLGVGKTSISALGSPSSCNGTKSTPCLSADLFGDWREELILWSKTDNATLNIYSTITSTNYRVPTLMHDHTYRMAICWQNVAYNQPPHLGYYLPDYIDSFQGKDPSDIREFKTTKEDDNTYYNMMGMPVTHPGRGVYILNGKKYIKK
jgi:hypothetical protein